MENKSEASSPTIDAATRVLKRARDNMPVDPAILAVEAIEIDIYNRRGLKNEWDEIEKGIRENDIKATWIEIIRQVIRNDKSRF